MKQHRFILNLLLFCISVSYSHAAESSYGWGASLFSTSSKEDYQQFTKQLNSWLLQNGFTPTKSKGVYNYVVGQYILVWTMVFNDKDKDVTANSSYQGSFTHDDLIEVRKTNYELWKSIFTWTASQKEKNDFILHDPNWRDKAITDVRKTYSNAIQP